MQSPLTFGQVSLLPPFFFSLVTLLFLIYILLLFHLLSLSLSLFSSLQKVHARPLFIHSLLNNPIALFFLQLKTSLEAEKSYPLQKKRKEK
jgi:hypothetical protein